MAIIAPAIAASRASRFANNFLNHFLCLKSSSNPEPMSVAPT